VFGENRKTGRTEDERKSEDADIWEKQ